MNPVPVTTAAPTERATRGLGLVGRPVAAPEVRHIVHGDRTILLDLRTERYLGLDGVGTAVWAMLIADRVHGVALQDLMDAIAMQFEAPRGMVERDLVVLLTDLARKGIVEGVVPGVVAPPPRMPSGARCTLSLVAAVLGLRLLRLRHSLALAHRLARKLPAVAVPTPEFLEAVVRKVDTAAAFFPGRALCLEQSLALYLVLRGAGVPVRLRLGAQPYPFGAHAWVEYQGEPVGESYDRVGKFVPFEGLGV